MHENHNKTRHQIVITLILLLLAVSSTGSKAIAAEDGIQGPDVTVIYLPSVSHYTGDVPGMHGYSVGTTSCNIGDQPLWWCDDTTAYCDDEQHPVIGQNLYRLKEGRFEQIGMSWLKHGFLSLNTPDGACGNCQTPPHGGDQLGVGCTDAYSSSLNGFRPLGLRSEVNAATGDFPFPETVVSWSTDIDQRIQIVESDLDPALNANAKYWIEGQYVAPDDAQEGNGLNNASYRQVLVQPNYDLLTTGITVREQAAIHAWKVEDSAVEIVEVDIPNTRPLQRFHAARRITQGEGTWHYEYVIHNLNSDRSARRLQIQFDSTAVITNAGFRDVDHHSGEVYDTTDWTIAVGSPPGSVDWSTSTFDTDENANALRWGTMYSFWFDADVPPFGAVHTLELFKPGAPTEVEVVFPDALVFADSFESGDTTGWTDSQP